MRLQAALEREYPNATFVILKSAQVSSQIACADPGSVLTSWNDVTFRAVVTVDENGLRVWDQFWGKRKNVAIIPWSRVHGLGLSMAKVRWRYVRAIDLQLTAEHGSPDVGVVLPPAKYNWGFRPLSDVNFRELHAQLGAHLAKSQAQAIVGSRLVSLVIGCPCDPAAELALYMDADRATGGSDPVAGASLTP